MAEAVPNYTLAQIAEALGGELIGDPDLVIQRPVPAGYPDPEGITFTESDHYSMHIRNKPCGAAIVKQKDPELPIHQIVVDQPRAAFMRVLEMFECPSHPAEGVHPTAVVSPDAELGEQVSIGAHCSVGASKIGDCVVIHSGARVSDRCSIGEKSVIHANAVLYSDTVLGSGCIIHSGAVIGSDGFGYHFDGQQQVKIAQVGRVVLGDDVEIGAQSTIDRATCGDTVIKRGTKIDNLVQIGHNVTIGEHCVIASQCGIGGSSKLGNRVTMGGQAGVSDHVTICDDVTLAARTGVAGSIDKPGVYIGYPEMPIGMGMRVLASLKELPSLLKRVKSLERDRKPGGDS